jgi:hypothetical protein
MSPTRRCSFRRLRASTGGAVPGGPASASTSRAESAPFLTWGNAAAAWCLLNTLSEHRITEELVDSKVLLKGAYSEVD